MPYHLPDEQDIGNCVIKFSLPADEKWATILIGAVAQLAREENWEPDTGGLTVAEAIETALAIRSSVEFIGCIEGNMQIKVGSYAGNGSDPQAITGVGFLPILVMVWMRHSGSNQRGIAFRATPDTLALTIGQANEAAQYKDDIVSLDADGFSVSSNGNSLYFNGNESGKDYTYICFA